MKKIWIAIIFISLLLTFTGCTPEENTETPDFNTYTEVVIEYTIVEPIYMIENIELTSENSIYLVIYDDIYKGTFLAVEEGDTLISFDFELDIYYWWDAVEDEQIHGYYK